MAQSSGGKQSISDQSIGFTLSVEADTSNADMRDSISNFEKLESTVKRVAQEVSTQVSAIVEEFNKLADAGSALQDGINLKVTGDKELIEMLKGLNSVKGSITFSVKEIKADQITANGFTGASAAAGATPPRPAGVPDPVSPGSPLSPVDLVPAVVAVLKALMSGNSMNRLLNLNKNVNRRSRREKKDTAAVVNHPAESGGSPVTAEEFKKVFLNAFSVGFLEAAGKVKGNADDTNKLIDELDKLGKERGFDTTAPSTMDRGVFKHTEEDVHKMRTDIHEMLKRMKNPPTPSQPPTPETVDPSEGFEDLIEGLGANEITSKIARIGTVISAAFGSGLVSAKSLFGYLRKEPVVVLSELLVVAHHAMDAYSDFNDTLVKVGQQTQATNKDLSKMGDSILAMSMKTGEGIDRIAVAASTLRLKGFTKLNDEFETMLNLSVKLGRIFGQNSGEMAEFLSEVTRGMHLSSKQLDEFGASLIKTMEAGGVSFDQLRENIAATKDVFRRFLFDSDQARLGALKGLNAMTQQLAKNLGSAGLAAHILSAATRPFEKEATDLIRVAQFSGDAAANIQDIQRLMKEGHPEKVFAMYVQGAKKMKEQFGDNFHLFAKNFGNEQDLIDAANVSLEDLDKTMKGMSTGKAAKTIDDQFNDMIHTWDGLKERMVNFFHVFMVYVGKPILEPLMVGLQTILKIFQLIPAPIMKVAGLITGMVLGVKIFSLMASTVGRLTKYLLASRAAAKGLRHEIEKTALAEQALGGSTLKVASKDIPRLTRAWRIFGKGVNTAWAAGGVRGAVRAIFGKGGKVFAGTALKETIPGFKWLRLQWLKHLRFAAGRGGTGSVIDGFLTSLKSGESVIGRFATRGLGLLTSEFAAVAAAVAAVVLVFQQLWSLAHGVMEKFQFKSLIKLNETLEKIKDGFTALKDAFKSVFTLDFDKATDFINEASDKLLSGLEELPDKISAYLDDLPKAIDVWFDNLSNTDFWDKIADKFLDFEKFAEAFERFSVRLGKLFLSLPLKVAKLYVQGINRMWTMFIHFFMDAAMKAGEALSDTVSKTMIDAVKKVPLFGGMLADGLQGVKDYKQGVSLFKDSALGKALDYGTPDAVKPLPVDTGSIATGTVRSDDGSPTMIEGDSSKETAQNTEQMVRILQQWIRQQQAAKEGNGNKTTNQYNIFGDRPRDAEVMERKGRNGI